jgi:hypothetical protein
MFIWADAGVFNTGSFVFDRCTQYEVGHTYCAYQLERTRNFGNSLLPIPGRDCGLFSGVIGQSGLGSTLLSKFPSELNATGHMTRFMTSSRQLPAVQALRPDRNRALSHEPAPYGARPRFQHDQSRSVSSNPLKAFCRILPPTSSQPVLPRKLWEVPMFVGTNSDEETEF